MISLITIQNYQAHRYSEIPFSPGVNIITGISDSGKSAILRAFEWVRKNRPSGDGPKHWYASDKEPVCVSVSMTDDVAIEKEKAAKVSYNLFADGEEMTFKAVKQDVPSEVADAFNLSDFNIQEQHQAHYLLSESAGEVSRILNKLVGFDVIDRLYKRLEMREHNANVLIKRGKEEVKDFSEEIEKLSYIEDADRDLKNIENDELIFNALDKDALILLNLIETRKTAKAEIERLAPLLKAKDKLDKILKLLVDYTKLSEEVVALNGNLENIKSIRESMKVEQDWLAVKPSYIKISESLDIWNKLCTDCVTLQMRFDRLENIRFMKKENEGKVTPLKEEYREILFTEKVCPTCFHPISEEEIIRIL